MKLNTSLPSAIQMNDFLDYKSLIDIFFENIINTCLCIVSSHGPKSTYTSSCNLQIKEYCTYLLLVVCDGDNWVAL